VRTAFLVRIASLLKDQHGVNASPTASFLDIEWEGLVFRLYLVVEHEFRLLEQQCGRLDGAVAAMEKAGLCSRISSFI
jgi:hypothetical protein